ATRRQPWSSRGPSGARSFESAHLRTVLAPYPVWEERVLHGDWPAPRGCDTNRPYPRVQHERGLHETSSVAHAAGAPRRVLDDRGRVFRQHVRGRGILGWG